MLRLSLADVRLDKDDADHISIEGAMSYLEDLGVSLEETVLLAVLTQVKAPTMGELTRSEFTTGWEALSAETLDKQKSQVAGFRKSLKTDSDFFRDVYRHSFVLAKQPSQKAVALDEAPTFWRLLYSPNGLRWESSGFNWLEAYITYLQEKWKKSISKDLWDQTLLFARKTLADPTLSWWNEIESAWPSVLDEFAKYVKELPQYKETFPPSEMDTEAD